MGHVWYLIVSIPILCTLTYFDGRTTLKNQTKVSVQSKIGVCVNGWSEFTLPFHTQWPFYFEHDYVHYFRRVLAFLWKKKKNTKIY